MTQSQEVVTELAFEPAYERLQAIAQRLSGEEVPVAEMIELFAEGRGLQAALSAFLDAQRARIEAIERGEGVRQFRITRTAPLQSAREDPREDP